ncbi:MAG: hypothetical protein ACC707_01515 [Thiohalomonadales bacterium]
MNTDNCDKSSSIKINKSLLVCLMAVTIIPISACKLPAEVRAEESARVAKEKQAQQNEKNRIAFCKAAKKLKKGMTDDEIEAIGIEVYPPTYRRKLKCDPQHANQLEIYSLYITLEFGPKCKVRYWELHPEAKCQIP